MKLSLNWLNDYIDLKNIPVKEMEHRITLSVCEVEGTQEVFTHLRDVIAVSISSVRPHPKADRLKICTADTGRERLQIVTGASNVKDGMTAVLAPAGTILRTEGRDPLEIKPANLRGADSFGMLLSAAELGLEKIFTGEGLLDLKEIKKLYPEIPEIKPGMRLSEILADFCDTVIEIDNKSITNRADLWSHFGFARELSALFRIPLHFDPLDFRKRGLPVREDENLPRKKILIHEKAAESYYGVHVKGIKPVRSPLRIAARLLNVGQKPVNSVVDASNYVMFETGQPNHTFDASVLRESTVSVVLNKDRRFSKFRTLDEEERDLPAEAILIIDGEPESGKPVAIGGIMGGMESGISDETRELFIESATFPRDKIRYALSKLQLRTDAAVRFEKGQDPANARPAIYRIIELLKLTNPDLKAGVITGEAPVPERRNEIRTSLSYIQDRLGFPLSAEEIAAMLESLGFEVQTEKKEGQITFVFKAPTYRSRHDVSMADDIIEELGRLYGYDNISPLAPVVPLEAVKPDEAGNLERRIKKELTVLGFTEVHNYSFISAKENALFGEKGIRILNPVVAGKDHMRLSLIPGILSQAALNQDRYENVRLFEFGRTYHKKDASLPEEKKRIALVHVTGETARHRKNLHEDDTLIFKEFLSMRAGLESMLYLITRGSFSTVSLNPDSAAGYPFLHPGGSVLWIDSRSKIIGVLGILHPDWQNAYDIRRSTLVADLSFDTLLPLHHTASRTADYVPPSVFPDSRFEISVILDDRQSTDLPVSLIKNRSEGWNPSPFISEIRYLSHYRGEPLPAGKKSVSYEIICRASDRTLSGDEIHEILESIVTRLQKAGIFLRQ